MTSSLTRATLDTPLLDEQGKVTYPWVKLFSDIGAESPALVTMTRAQRLNSSGQPEGTLVYESDTGLIYRMAVTAGRAAWRYVAGTYKRTQAQLAALALPATVDDTGMLVEVTDFRHILRWSGTGWQWGPGEDGRHDFVDMPIAPDDLTGWQACDGSTTSYLKGDGTTAAYTTPTLMSGVYRKGGNYTGTIAAAATSLVLAGTTDNEDAHTHAIDHDHPAEVSSGNTGSITAASGSGTPAAGNGHTHTVDLAPLAGDSGAGVAHHHNLTSASATLTGKVLVSNIAVPVYFRR